VSFDARGRNSDGIKPGGLDAVSAASVVSKAFECTTGGECILDRIRPSMGDGAGGRLQMSTTLLSHQAKVMGAV
jgi:hypothetical protein